MHDFKNDADLIANIVQCIRLLQHESTSNRQTYTHILNTTKTQRNAKILMVDKAASKRTGLFHC